jgi:hypothetical protein
MIYSLMISSFLMETTFLDYHISKTCRDITGVTSITFERIPMALVNLLYSFSRRWTYGFVNLLHIQGWIFKIYRKFTAT